MSDLIAKLRRCGIDDAADTIESLVRQVADLEAERALIVARAENAEAALADVTELYTQACEQRDDADALLRESVPFIGWGSRPDGLMERIDAHLARKP